LQFLFGVGQLALVDDQAGVDRLALKLAGYGRRNNLVEWHHDVSKVAAQAKTQRQVRRRERSWYRNGLLAQRGKGGRLAGNDHRPVALAHARSAGAERIAIGEIRVAVNANGRELQFAAEGAAVERFDVDQLVAEFEIVGVDLA